MRRLLVLVRGLPPHARVWRALEQAEQEHGKADRIRQRAEEIRARARGVTA